MNKTILYRILYFFPILFIASGITFGLKEMSQGDPVLDLCGRDGILLEEDYLECVKKNRLDRPAFYLAITPRLLPSDTLYQIFPLQLRKNLKQALWKRGNWPQLESLSHEVALLLRQTNAKELSLLQKQNLQNFTTPDQALKTIHSLQSDPKLEHYTPLLDRIEQKYEAYSKCRISWKDYLPAFYYFGFDNRFHNWFRAALNFDFGRSLSGIPVKDLLRKGVKWTLIINVLGLLIGIFLGVSLGSYAGLHPNTKFSIFIDRLFNSFFAIPSFLMAILLIYFFSNANTFPFLYWFPNSGTGYLGEDYSIFENALSIAHHLFLPIICESYIIIAYLYKHAKAKVEEESQKPYVFAQKAMGHQKEFIFKKYIFPNSLIPLISLIGTMIPSLFAGSIIIESIFSIPGLGGLVYQSYLESDWQIVFASVFISTILSLLGLLLADILYLFMDPKIRYARES